MELAFLFFFSVCGSWMRWNGRDGVGRRSREVVIEARQVLIFMRWGKVSCWRWSDEVGWHAGRRDGGKSGVGCAREISEFSRCDFCVGCVDDRSERSFCLLEFVKGYVTAFIFPFCFSKRREGALDLPCLILATIWLEIRDIGYVWCWRAEVVAVARGDLTGVIDIEEEIEELTDLI